MAQTTYDTFARGRRFFDLGDPISAARILAPLAEAEPDSRSVLELLGRAYFHSAQLNRAEATFRRLIELDPCDAWAHIALARSLERQSRDTEAAPHRRMHAAMAGGSLD
ncbi:Flp pilus assembly protein TadD [Spinactinospora alkalitolerans]|uniref:Flp pilus assembly protein TadD n=1 Tax=Spinactinospora alkalitolerans TaxID=687207 RepID=A0A852TR23_9ACTN|nr:tetratricopeptide repeat protein [Spinactinospora alkalitolerans]NYE46439.1 Flp pilus assembly protein TadD [Spinactinospora alkalitolerans]